MHTAISANFINFALRKCSTHFPPNENETFGPCAPPPPLPLLPPGALEGGSLGVSENVSNMTLRRKLIINLIEN